MPDEPIVEPAVNMGATPAFDMEALGEMFDKKLQEGLAKLPQPHVATPPPSPPIADPVGDLLRPHLSRVQMVAEDARDSAAFYRDHRDLEPDERVEVEKQFDVMVKAGRPMNREDIYNWHVGKNRDAYFEKQQKKAADKVAAAQSAQGVVGGGRQVGGGTKDPYEMDDADLTKALSGQSF